MKRRIIGIDLLRIVSMFMVMTLHTMSNGGGLLYHQVNTWHTQTIMLMTFLNNIAVDLFALISGYVGLYSHHKTSRIVELWLQVVFYSWFIMFFFCLWKPISVSHTQIINSLFPTLSMQYWYFNSYLLLFVLMPLINVGVVNIPHKRFKRLCIFLFLLTSCMGAVFFKDVFKLSNGLSGIWLIILYIYGTYLRKYGNYLKRLSIKTDLLIYLGISILGVIICNLMVLNSKGYSDGSVMYSRWPDWFNYNTPFAVIGAVFTFLAFLQIKIRNVKLRRMIIKLGSLSFGTYLLQTNYITYGWFNGHYQEYYNYNIPLMIGAVLLTAFVWYCFGTLVDYIRNYLFKKLKIVNKVLFLVSKLIHLAKFLGNEIRVVLVKLL